MEKPFVVIPIRARRGISLRGNSPGKERFLDHFAPPNDRDYEFLGKLSGMLFGIGFSIFDSSFVFRFLSMRVETNFANSWPGYVCAHSHPGTRAIRSEEHTSELQSR